MEIRCSRCKGEVKQPIEYMNRIHCIKCGEYCKEGIKRVYLRGIERFINLPKNHRIKAEYLKLKEAWLKLEEQCYLVDKGGN